MKTWEIIKMIEEDYSNMRGKKYRLINYGYNSVSKVRIGTIAEVDTTIYGSGLHVKGEILYTNGFEIWEEIKKPIKFEEVLELINSENNIHYIEFKLILDDIVYRGYLDEILNEISGYYTDYMVSKFLTQGKWYIE